MGRLRFLLLAATVGSAPVLAEPAYPFGVTLTIRPEAMRASVMHEPGWVSSPSNPSGTVEVGKQASDAWGALVARRFAAGPPPTAEIEVLAVHASLEPDGDVWDAVVEHEVVFRAAGNELGHWNLQASAAVNGLGQAAIPRAFALAADRAARSFEAQFAQAGGVREWLAQRKITVIPVAPPAIADMPRVARSVPRSPFGFYVDVGLLDAESSSTLTTTGAGTRDSAANGFSLALRTGFSLRWALIQFAATKWSFSSALLNGDVDATALGIDVAPALRL